MHTRARAPVQLCPCVICRYANSSDGIVWEKPSLGLVDVGKLVPSLKALGKNNNIVMEGGGIGIYRDTSVGSSTNRATTTGSTGARTTTTNGTATIIGRFKAIGAIGMNGPAPPGAVATAGAMRSLPAASTAGATGSLMGDATAVSDDGLVWDWAHAQVIGWRTPQRNDCHNNVFWDDVRGQYVATTRDVRPSACDAKWNGQCQRDVAMASSMTGQGFAFDG